MAFIYVITNDINNKQYVGKTNNSIEKRFKEHVKDRKRRNCEKRPLYDAMNKYGIEHFSIELLEECDYKESSNREIYWINKLNTYHNGYNATLGEDSKHYYDYKEISNKYLELQNIKETAKFFDCSADTVKTACKQTNTKMLLPRESTKKAVSKKVVMLNKDTEEEIKIFNSLSEAGLFLGDKRKSAHIGKVCNGVRKIAYGYKWKFI